MTTTSVPPDTAPWPDDMVLTEAHARWLMDRGACDDALGYVGWTVAAAVKARPWAALDLALDRLTDTQFAAVVKTDSECALRFAPNRLTDEQFADAARIFPHSARIYAPARYRRLCATA